MEVLLSFHRRCLGGHSFRMTIGGELITFDGFSMYFSPFTGLGLEYGKGKSLLDVLLITAAAHLPVSSSWRLLPIVFFPALRSFSSLCSQG